MKIRSEFISGMTAGIPIGLGYLSVSFGFGIAAVRLGISAFNAFIISLTNLTSAGQAQGIEVIATNGTLIEMAIVQLVINLRYALMGISLSQNLDPKFTLRHRFIAAYGITDEIFAICSTRKKPVTPSFMYGVIIVSTFGWTLGTYLGAVAGEILPSELISAMGIMLYGMFIAIIVPPAAEKRSILIVVVFASGLSVLCKYLLPFLSGGFTVIICGIAASLLGALLFPVKEEAKQ